MAPRPLTRTRDMLSGPHIVAGMLLAIAPCLAPAFGADNVVAKPIVLNDNGAWSWFEDERAVVDAASGQLLVSSVADSAGAGGAGRNGDIDLAALNMATGAVERFVLHAALEDDDHNSASIWVRPDGRYLAMYARHGGDPLSRYRISTAPHDASSWSAEQSFTNAAGATYSNLHYLPADNGGAGRLYNFTRTLNYDPNVLISEDLGATWSYGGKLLTEGGGGDRPYVRYFDDGAKIHFIATERHPRDYDNSIYYGYVQDGQLYNAGGAVVDANVLDASGVAPATLSPVMLTGTVVDGAAMRHMWTVDTAVDANGQPVVAFQARADNDDRDHRFFYGQLSGGAWQVHPLGYAGSYLYAAENDYTGLVSIDPDDPSTVYLSSEVHPATQAQLIGADGQRHYELFRGTTADGGATWTWSPITFNSTRDNIRPVVPQWDETNSAVLWLRGDYFSYTSYDLDVVGLINPDIPTPELALAIDFGATGQLVQSDFDAFTRNAAPTGTGQSESFDSPYAAAGAQVTVTLGGDIQFADGGDDVAAPLGDVAADFARSAGDVTLTLGNLARGNYQLVVYAHDRSVQQADYNIQVNGVAAGRLAPESGANPDVGIASSRILIGASGADDVTLTLARIGDSGDVVLNGLELYFVGAYAPPFDLNADGALDLHDYQKFVQGWQVDLTELTAQQAYELGDLNGDYQNNFADFRLFKSAYIQWNGPAAFAALTAAVPEPAAGAQAVVAASVAVAVGRWSTRFLAAALVLLAGLVVAIRPAAAALTYVDASRSLNTGPAAAFTNGVNNNADDNLWTERTGFASRGNVFQSGDGNGEDAPEISTVLSGLAPHAAYAVYVHFWDASGGVEDWSIRGGFTAGELQLFANPGDAGDVGAANATLASMLDYDTPPDLFTEGNRTMYAGFLGYAPANAAGQLTVYVDDLPSQIGVNNRSWYDGVSYELISVPTLQVNTSTGYLRLVNDTPEAIDIDYYEIRSRGEPLGALNPPGWISLDDQEHDGFGMGWEEATGADAHLLSEGNLTSSTLLGAGDSLSLGNGFAIGAEQDLEFFYASPGGALQQGVVAYATGLAGDFDDDGAVAGPDFLRWQQGALSMPPVAGDLADWQANFGLGSIGRPLSASVPEPPTVWSTFAILLVVFGLRAREATLQGRPGQCTIVGRCGRFGTNRSRLPR
ncbi:MAG: hypothetical protein CMJ58_19870 [Planctomycetaceae bacterium]|nr:hypothetical protein [Planctomycetaceae bacterium]